MNTENKPKMTRILAAVVDTRNLTMYKEDGSIITIPQGDARLRQILEVATPQLIRQNWADVCIEAVGDNSYAKFEQEGSGAVKFFHIAKDKLKNLFSEVKPPEPVDTSPVPVMSIGAVPEILVATINDARQDLVNVIAAAASATPVSDHIANAGIYDVSEEDEALAAMETSGVDPAELAQATADLERDTEIGHPEFPEDSEPKLEQTMNAIDEIMKHAVPVQSEDFHEKDVAAQGRIVEASGETIKAHGSDQETHTIIAVVDNKVIPGMEKIKTQFGRAAKMGSTVGVENFLRRLASVIEQRQHSVEDLLKFMERADLPIADDGTILIYKVLCVKKKEDKEYGSKTIYVDCHTGNVEQFVGAYVCMDVSLVDRNRNNECSNGLHVARRGYIREFSGDVCVLAKLAPEDVIAVPTYDANKMRVCGYHIIAELGQAQYNEVKANRPITSTEEGKKLLAKAIAGEHINKTHEVRITEQKGGGVVITKLERKIVPVEVEAEEPVKAEALSNPEAEALDQPTDPKDVVKAVEQAVEKEVLSRKEQAKILYDACAYGGQAALDELKAFKKAARVSWEKLGLPELNGSTFSIREPKPTKQEAMKGKKMVPPSVFKKPAPTPSVFPKDVTTKTIPTPPSRIVNGVELGLGTPRERIQKLLAIGLTSQGIAGAIFKIKQQSKKNWTSLGVTEVQVAEIMRLKGSV